MKNDSTKHTPGPWTTQFRDGGDDPALIMNHDGWCVGESANGLPGGLDEMLANERLICAAPDLLAALRDLLEYPENGTPLHPGSLAWETARGAIAKAEGREVAP